MFYREKQHNILIEPLTCIFRIILLKYKEEGTKISIQDNSIQYNDPNYYQGIVRMFNGDTRNDLHNLYNPFMKSFEWYPVTDKYNQLFYQKCSQGLEILMNSYQKESIIYHTLNHYKQIFDNVLSGKPIQLQDSIQSPLLNDLQNIWNKNELEIIYKMILYLDTCDVEDKEVYLDIIETIISTKEKKVNEYITKSSTTYN
tara:strand:- start:12703 stop:13302 length:600 start_codon:yes stop_codon:yes gene_type:complete